LSTSTENGSKPMANSYQVGGNHYRDCDVQPWDIIDMYGLGYFDGNAVKYLLRWRRKNGVEDLRKAIHFIEKLIELEEEAEPTSDTLSVTMALCSNGEQRPAHGED